MIQQDQTRSEQGERCSDEALHRAVEALISAFRARAEQPLPALNSTAFLCADEATQVTALLALAAAYLLGAELVDQWLGADYLDGQYHRPNAMPAFAELDRLRYPPTGDRELWVRYGPAGPPADVRQVAA